MPFINEKLDANRKLIDKELHSKNASRTSRFLFEPDTVIGNIRARIVGQDHVLSSLEDMLYSIKADFGEEKRPLAVSFFLGPTGVGKTETVRILAEAISGTTQRLCRIDMNTLAQEHYAAALTGAPPGYVGSKEGHSLFDVETIQGSFSRPGIVLFDEIEKASTEVIRALLNVLDTGRLVLPSGTKEIDFSNAMIFMTSNVGAHKIQALRNAHRKGWRKWLARDLHKKESEVLKKSLNDTFDSEFLNRIDRILTFKPLCKHSVDSILDIELEKLNLRLKRKNAVLTLQSSARDKLHRYYDQEYGARNLATQLRTKLKPLLARTMLKDYDAERFRAEYSENTFSVTAEG